jgi:hypothetical protein
MALFRSISHWAKDDGVVRRVDGRRRCPLLLSSFAVFFRCLFRRLVLVGSSEPSGSDPLFLTRMQARHLTWMRRTELAPMDIDTLDWTSLSTCTQPCRSEQAECSESSHRSECTTVW